MESCTRSQSAGLQEMDLSHEEGGQGFFVFLLKVHGVEYGMAFVALRFARKCRTLF